MSHLESLVAAYLDWQGYLVRRNTKVGRLAHGGWEMELDIVGYHPKTQKLLHYEPSIDALSWDKREARYLKKFSTEVRAKVVARGRIASNAISEKLPLLRTLQLSRCLVKIGQT